VLVLATGGGLRHAAAPPVPVGRHHAAAEGARSSRWLLHRVITRLDVRWDVETLINIPTTMLIGIALVIFAFNLAIPISKLSVSAGAAARWASRWPACCCPS
jgi:hypothetical protein